MPSPNIALRGRDYRSVVPITTLLNEDCACGTLDREAFGDLLREQTAYFEGSDTLAEARPHLASETFSLLSREDDEQIRAAINAIEAATRLPAYRRATLGPDLDAPELGAAGAFMGYDFHITPEGPRLIEINTNAGGAFLNALILKAHNACCTAFEPLFREMRSVNFESAAFAMFTSEWRRQRRNGGPLTRVAIVDDAPQTQYLYPELLIAKRFFEQRGVEAVIADAGDLVYHDGNLIVNGKQIDLVYNRLVDFSLTAPEHSILAKAYQDNAVVVTPNPRHHALYANKQNLAILSDSSLMRAWGLSEEKITALQVIPHTDVLTKYNADTFWNNRKEYYFKPVDGYGSKAVYRGAKLTKSKWSEISTGGYVAQKYVRPGERMVSVGGEGHKLKMDVRFYTYNGDTLIAAARLYQGQTTNFRTPGGGFSPIIFLPDNLSALIEPQF